MRIVQRTVLFVSYAMLVRHGPLSISFVCSLWSRAAEFGDAPQFLHFRIGVRPRIPARDYKYVLLRLIITTRADCFQPRDTQADSFVINEQITLCMQLLSDVLF